MAVFQDILNMNGQVSNGLSNEEGHVVLSDNFVYKEKETFEVHRLG